MADPVPEKATPGEDGSAGYELTDAIGAAILAIGASQILILVGLLLWVKKRKMDKQKAALKELEKAQSEDGVLIGGGSSGQVFQKKKKNGTLCAEKAVKLKKNMSEQQISALVEKVREMTKLRHENVISIHGCTHVASRQNNITCNTLHITMELSHAGPLSDFLKSEPLPLEHARKYTIDILEGLTFLHGKNVLHRDLKCANVLLTSDGVAKLSDYGDLKEVETHGCNVLIGTPPWMAPEAVKGDPSKPSDVWSVGCCLVEMLTTRPPWGTFDNNFQAMFTIGNWTEPLPPKLPHNPPTHCLSFLEACFAIDPSRRSLAGHLVSHPFLNPVFEPPPSLSQTQPLLNLPVPVLSRQLSRDPIELL